MAVDTLLAPGDSDGSDDDDGGGMRRCWGNIALPLAEDLLLDAVVDDDGCCTPLLFSWGCVVRVAAAAMDDVVRRRRILVLLRMDYLVFGAIMVHQKQRWACSEPAPTF